MPRLIKFEIRNFKGIEKTSIILDDRSNSSVITLIGLNESGKTTILEALSHFVSSNNLVSSLFKTDKKKNYTDIIPINKRAAFSSSVEIEATVELDKLDIKRIVDLAKIRNFEIDTKKLSEVFTVTQELVFEDSILLDSNSMWNINIFCRKPGDREFENSELDIDENSIWVAIVNLIEADLPSVAYFPTFLVDIPNRVYLCEHENETPTNQHYRSIFQSIMEGIDDGLDLEKHVSNRVKNYISRMPYSNWQAQFTMSSEKSIIDSVFQKVSASVTREVIGGWRRVFSKETTAKQISVDWNIDTNKGNLPYASFMVSDGENKYEIGERSLGFRWFFSFLIFTAFKGQNNKPKILIFDEPAANLHAKAQAELLKSFEKIATNGTKIIYSTHSHHMINPRWLGGAYIIENTALDFDEETSFEFSSSNTNIKATKYKEFISNYPSRSSYFQPVIECLDYISPEIIGNPPFVLVEGISDYHALTIAQKFSKINLHYRIIPGSGSGASGPLISLMMGRGERFIILLDDDKAGKKESVRYKDNWYLTEESVLTLSEIDSKFSGFSLEKLLDENTIDLIRSHLNISGVPSKKQIGWYLAEICAQGGSGLSRETMSDLIKILEFLNQKFS